MFITDYCPKVEVWRQNKTTMLNKIWFMRLHLPADLSLSKKFL